MKYPKYLPTLIWIILILNVFVIGYLIHRHMVDSCTKATAKIPPMDTPPRYDIWVPPTYGNGQVWPPDILNNQYAQPIKDSRYIPMNVVGIHTNIGYVDTAYRQVGILGPMYMSTPNENKQDLLILMGRPLYVNRNKWQYYALSNQRNGIKLTVFVKGKSSTNEYGVDEVYSNDEVRVQGYQNRYKVDLYENNYLP